jgi:hypothetical protein
MLADLLDDQRVAERRAGALGAEDRVALLPERRRMAVEARRDARAERIRHLHVDRGHPVGVGKDRARRLLLGQEDAFLGDRRERHQQRRESQEQSAH